mmetsp:Transcript_24123/g.27938  ORF Transcript_24123/g.27938 Transcript_24123/m.27938 type:complete len:327 (+) Transcript_24123:151-1131(+)
MNAQHTTSNLQLLLSFVIPQKTVSFFPFLTIMMMTGGDDLESDDEYLDQNWGKTETVSVAADETVKEQKTPDGIIGLSKKRSLSEAHDDHDGEEIMTLSKKKKPTSSKKLLREACRGIAEETPEIQAAFLWTCFTNALKLQGTEIPEEKFNGSNFALSVKDNKQNKAKYDQSMAKFLKSGVLSSGKKLKKWRHNKSPMVIIICVSARRAVSILKDISSLNVRAAKLFAKHMNVEEQNAMLRENKYSIAVGTPNRLLKLLENKGDDCDDEGELCLDQTELIIIDCYEDKKRFTVCTLNDTAPDLMRFIHQGAFPQLTKRKSLKFALF